MIVTIGSNLASLQAQRQLTLTEGKLSNVFERLSSGQRINSASDDAAGLAISESLRTDARVFDQAIRNLNDGISLLNIADSTLGELSKITIRIGELAEQSANGSLSSQQRQSLDAEAQALEEEFYRVRDTATFNGQPVLSEDFGELVLQGGYGTDGAIVSRVVGQSETRVGDGTFGSLSTYSIGQDSFNQTLADVNNDGIADLVNAARGDDEVNIFIGNGDGTFGDRTDVVVENGPSSVIAADINGDGNADLITGNLYGGGDVTVLFGNGNGTFEAPATVGSSDGASSADVGDFDGDGILDLVVGGSAGARVLTGNGDGTFGAAFTLTPSNSSIRKVVDVTNDGVLDIFFEEPGNPDVLAVRVGNGDGTFSSPPAVDSDDSLGPFTFGDFNNDGFLDVLSNSADADSLSVRTGQGDGTFGAISLGDEIGGSDFESGDFNGDGNLDFVQATGGSLVFYAGNGNGTFDAAPSEPFGASGSTGITVGDIDGDGVDDVMGSNFFSDELVVVLGNSRDKATYAVELNEFNLLSQSAALRAIDDMKSELASLSFSRGVTGALQSRIGAALSTLSATSENSKAAESRIKDADIAFESSQLTRLNILQQAAAAVLAQANQQPGLALQLLQ